MHLGRKIKLARMAKGYTQQELAERINRTRPLVSHIERTGKANHYTLRAICGVLGLEPDDIEYGGMLAEESLSSQTGHELLLLKMENRLLRQEIATFKELVASQKHFIQLLLEKEKLS